MNPHPQPPPQDAEPTHVRPAPSPVIEPSPATFQQECPHCREIMVIPVAKDCLRGFCTYCHGNVTARNPNRPPIPRRSNDPALEALKDAGRRIAEGSAPFMALPLPTRRKLILSIAAAGMLLTLLFPPWEITSSGFNTRSRYYYDSRAVTFAPLVSPPRDASIYFAPLLLEWTGLAVLTLGALHLLAGPLIPERSPSAPGAPAGHSPTPPP